MSSYWGSKLAVFLKGDAMLTWNNIEKLGGSKTYLETDPRDPPMDTLLYRIIDDKMHICAGDKKTDSCQVNIYVLSLSFYFYFYF